MLFAILEIHSVRAGNHRTISIRNNKMNTRKRLCRSMNFFLTSCRIDLSINSSSAHHSFVPRINAARSISTDKPLYIVPYPWSVTVFISSPFSNPKSPLGATLMYSKREKEKRRRKRKKKKKRNESNTRLPRAESDLWFVDLADRPNNGVMMDRREKGSLIGRSDRLRLVQGSALPVPLSLIPFFRFPFRRINWTTARIPAGSAVIYEEREREKGESTLVNMINFRSSFEKAAAPREIIS